MGIPRRRSFGDRHAALGAGRYGYKATRRSDANSSSQADHERPARLTRRRPSASNASDTPAAADRGDIGGPRTGTANASSPTCRPVSELNSVVTTKNYADLVEDESLQLVLYASNSS